MLQLTRDLPPAPAPIHRQSKDIVVAVHTVYVVVPSVDLLELSRDLLPSSCARLLALEYVVVGVDSPDVDHTLQTAPMNFNERYIIDVISNQLTTN